MSVATDYLEAARIDEIATELEAQGYEVERPNGHEQPNFDLVARRGNAKVAVEVKASPKLRDSAPLLRRLRDRAHNDGFTEFRLALVNPPREIAVVIVGFDSALLEHMRNYPPSSLDQLSTDMSILAVSDVYFREVAIDRAGVRVSGSGIVDVSLKYESSGQDSSDMVSDFPFTFVIHLDHELRINEVEELDVDTTSFNE